MAEDYQDKTEKPTPKRRAEARKKGQIPRSRDLSAAVVLLTGFVILALYSPNLTRKSMELFRASLAGLGAGLVTTTNIPFFYWHFSSTLASFLAPVMLGLVVVSVLVNYAQGGWVLSTEMITPKLERLQFLSGFKRLFSPNSLVMLVKNLAKVVLIGWVVYLILKGEILALLPLLYQDPGQILIYLGSTGLRVAIWIIVALVAIGALDYVYQRWRMEKSLKMTKQEVKDEFRQTEGDPKVKARIKSIMRDMAAKRMMAQVPKADVVVTNPTRLAIALRYDNATMMAPEVVAKGRGFVALKIMDVAREAGVPLVENRDLARSLFRLVEVGDSIPTSLYRAVAEVLAYIYSLKAAAGAGR
ncbi:MAG: flagellar biosynthesis protein FlhB [Thermodesulfobacteriota bacterium]